MSQPSRERKQTESVATPQLFQRRFVTQLGRATSGNGGGVPVALATDARIDVDAECAKLKSKKA